MYVCSSFNQESLLFLCLRSWLFSFVDFRTICGIRYRLRIQASSVSPSANHNVILYLLSIASSTSVLYHILYHSYCFFISPNKHIATLYLLSITHLLTILFFTSSTARIASASNPLSPSWSSSGKTSCNIRVSLSRPAPHRHNHWFHVTHRSDCVGDLLLHVLGDAASLQSAPLATLQYLVEATMYDFLSVILVLPAIRM